MKAISIALFLLFVPTTGAMASATNEPTIAQIVEEFEKEVEPSERPPTLGPVDPEFEALQASSAALGEELRKPGNERIRLLVILQRKLDSINTVKNTISEEQTKSDDMSKYLVARYQSRLASLREDVDTINRALSALH